jgi:hypothetical protein
LNPLHAHFARNSRFRSVGLVLDLQDAASGPVLSAVASTDALRVVTLARSLGSRFVVLAGQLYRKRAGAYGSAVQDVKALPTMALTAFYRLGECGETVSAWSVVGSDEMREAVLAALAGVMATEGHA